jgi:hypothetical protein
MPVMGMVTAVPLATGVEANEKVIVPDASEVVPLEGRPVTTPSPGVPAVPGGTVIVTEVRLAELAVVNVYV